MALLINVTAFRTLPEMHDVCFYAPYRPFLVPFPHFSQILCVFAISCVCISFVFCLLFRLTGCMRFCQRLISSVSPPGASLACMCPLSPFRAFVFASPLCWCMPTSLHFSYGLFSGLKCIFILGRRIFTLVPLTDLFSRLDSDPGFNLQLVLYTAMLATAEKNTVNKRCRLEIGFNWNDTLAQRVLHKLPFHIFFFLFFYFIHFEILPAGFMITEVIEWQHKMSVFRIVFLLHF